MALKLGQGLPMSERLPDWKMVERAYEGMSRDRLLAELTRINEALATQTRSVVSQQITYQPDLDLPVIRSQKTEGPSRPPDHERRPSQPSQPGALDLLISGHRMGPRLARKLTLASARARTRRS